MNLFIILFFSVICFQSSSADRPLKVWGYFDEIFHDIFRDYISSRLAPAAYSWIEATMSVKYPIDKIQRTSETFCTSDGYGLQTPLSLSSGLSSDYQFVHAILDFDDEDSTIIGTTITCTSDNNARKSRPIIARTRFNRYHLVIHGDQNTIVWERNLNIFLREILHSMGFSFSSYELGFYENGTLLPQTYQSGKNFDGTLGRTLIILSPVLRDYLRLHFKCDNITGAMMENDDRGYRSNFEKRLFGPELMTNGEEPGKRISMFTLKFLEGTGWYSIDYSFAEPNNWGKNAGCNFYNSATQKSALMTEQAKNEGYGEFCSAPQRLACSSTGSGGGTCMETNAVPGYSFVHLEENRMCQSPDSEYISPSLREKELQSFGLGSRSTCFLGDLRALDNRKNRTTTYCFVSTCSSDMKKIHITVGLHQVTCNTDVSPKAGDYVGVTGYLGGIICPDPVHYCSTVVSPSWNFCPKNCLGRGECVDAICHCYEPYIGFDCGLKYI